MASRLPSREVEKRLQATDWPPLQLRLLDYAQVLITTKVWPGGHPPGALEAQDLVLEAIGALYSGERQWDPQEYPNLESVLKGIIKSKVSHAATAADNVTRHPLSDSPGVNGWGHEAYSPDASPEEDLVYQQLLSRIEKVGEEDEIKGLVLLCIQEGIRKPREIAEELGWPIKDVNRVLRQIRRVFQKEQEIEGGKAGAHGHTA